jgi:hypothetical protein
MDQQEPLLLRVKDFVISQLREDGIHFENEMYAGLLAEFSAQLDEGRPYNEQEFLQQLDSKVKGTAITLLTPRHELADWGRHQIEVKHESMQLHKTVVDPVMYIKKKQLAKMKAELQQELKARQSSDLPYDDLLDDLNKINQVQIVLNSFTNTVVQR